MPPVAATLRILLPAVNPRYLPSGDQNGAPPPSVPSTGCASASPNARTQIRPAPLYATRSPSGDTLIFTGMAAGAGIVNRVGVRPKGRQTTIPATSAMQTAAVAAARAVGSGR